ncbi:hypothetical protein LTR50_002059 [Elasticomyces elasticus]|nr:hypothetical protein LTR50_002059 [Elasticomyces elasticus]
MSGLEVLAVVSCVAAVVSAFHGGAELIETVKKKHKKRKKERDCREEILQESLFHGEREVKSSYDTEYTRFGAAFSVGDDIARHQLLQVAVKMQAEIIRSLQIACEFEKDVLNLTQLHEASIINRLETIRSFEELRQRILVAMPIGGLLATEGFEARSRQSADNLMSFMTANAVSPDMIPSAVTIPDEPENRLSRFLSTRPKVGRQGAKTGSSGFALAPTFDWLIPAIRRHDTDILTLCGEAIHHEDDKEDVTNKASSQRDSVMASGDTFSEQDWRSMILRAFYHTGPNPIAIAQDNDASSRQHSLPHSSLPPPPITQQRHHSLALPRSFPTQPPPGTHPAFRPSVSSTRSESTPTFTHTPTPQLIGRPHKENNYWGFCRGAWDCRESLSSGLEIHLQPVGITGTLPHWQCKRCQFRSTALRSRTTPPDPRIHVAECGIRYRWAFLARSHVRCKNAVAGPGEYAYGCVFCSSEARETGVYGNVETLLAHVGVRHGGRMTDKMLEQTRCIEGRVAEAAEEWDVNIPFAH